MVLKKLKRYEECQCISNQTLKGIITSDQAIVEVNPILLLIDEYDVKSWSWRNDW